MTAEVASPSPSPSIIPSGRAVLRAANGATAALVGPGGAACLEVRDAQARLLFRHDPATGQTVVGIPEGDLAFEIPKGGLEVRAAQGVRLRGATLDLEAETARMRFGKLETVVGRLVERARTVYRRVDELTELRTGRLRYLCEGLLQLRGASAALKATGVVRVDGEKIELG